MATKSSVMNLGFSAEGIVKELGKVSSSARELDKAFTGISGAASKYVESFTRSLKDLTTVSDKLPVTSKSLKTIFDSVDSLRVNKDKPAYIENLAKSLTKFYMPLQVLTQLNIDPAITRLNNLFTSFEKIPSKAKVDNLNALAGAIRKFSAASKTLQGIPTNVPFFSGGGGSGGSGGSGGGGGSRGGGGGGWSTPTPLTLPGGTGGAPVPLPAYGGTGTPPPSSFMGKAALAGQGISSFMKTPAGGALAAWATFAGSIINERALVEQQLGTQMDFDRGYMGYGSRPGSQGLATMMDQSAIKHGISYADAASLLTSYRKYGAGGLRDTGLVDPSEMAKGRGQAVASSYEGYVTQAKRTSRQLGIDLDVAGDIVGSTRKNLQITDDATMKQFGDSLAYVSKKAAMSTQDTVALSREIGKMGVMLGKSGEEAKNFSQDMMVAAGALGQAGVSGNVLSSMNKGMTGSRREYISNKIMGITADMSPQERAAAKQRHYSMLMDTVGGMGADERNLVLGMYGETPLAPDTIEDITKLGKVDSNKFRDLMRQQSKEITQEQGLPSMAPSTLLGSGKNILRGGVGNFFSQLYGSPTNLLPGMLPVNMLLERFTGKTAMQNAFAPFSEKKAAGGIVGGSGESDSVPAMLTPGEEVLRKDDPRHSGNLTAFTKGIAQIEGYYAEGKTPNRPQRNLNPGNLRVAGWSPKADPSKMMHMARVQGAVGYDPGGYLKFESEEAGFAGLERQIRIDASRGMNTGAFIEKYAPASENDTANYKAFIAKKGFASGMGLQDIIGGSVTQMASVASSKVDKATSTLSSAGSSIMSHLGSLFNFTQNLISNVTKKAEVNTDAGTRSLANVSASTTESADKFTQAADVMMQAAQTMSSAVVAQSSRGNSDQHYRIANIARGNMVS